MSVTLTIYDWPSTIIPINQLFYAGGQASEGAYTIGGVQITSPEVGGRAILEASFNYLKDDRAARIASWLFSKVSNGSIFRLRIFRSLQLATTANFSIRDEVTGLPWSNDQPWSSEFNWAYSPVVKATQAAQEGDATLVVDCTPIGTLLDYGHVIGPATGGAHMIDNISYDGLIATLTLSPPLRRAVAVDGLITLRPTMYGTVDSPENFRSMFEAGRWVRPGNIVFTEAIV